MFAASKADHVTADQHANLVSLLQQLVKDAWQNAAFEGISMDCAGVAAIQSMLNGAVMHQGQSLPALKGDRLQDGAPLTFYPGEVPARLPGPAFGNTSSFSSRPSVRRRVRATPRYHIFAWMPSWRFCWGINYDDRSYPTAY
ncbi:hypothetical protein SODG_004247 [Sodalis praecaptivus]